MDASTAFPYAATKMNSSRSTKFFLIALFAAPIVGCNASIGSIGRSTKTVTPEEQSSAVAQNLRDEMNNQQQQRDSAMTGANRKCADIYRSSRVYGGHQFEPSSSYHRYLALSVDGKITEITAGLVNDGGRTAFQCTINRGGLYANRVKNSSGTCTQYDSQYRFISKREYPDFYVLQPLVEGNKIIFYTKSRQLMSCAFGAVAIKEVFTEVDKMPEWESYPLSTNQGDRYVGSW